MKNLNGQQVSLMTNKTRKDFGLPPRPENNVSIHPYGRKRRQKKED